MRVSGEKDRFTQPLCVMPSRFFQTIVVQYDLPLGFCWKRASVTKDWELIELIRDAGESAKTLNRPGLLGLTSMVEARQVEAVLVYKLDRLTRSVSVPTMPCSISRPKASATATPQRRRA
jgi:hypothetical protein